MKSLVMACSIILAIPLAGCDLDAEIYGTYYGHAYDTYKEEPENKAFVLGLHTGKFYWSYSEATPEQASAQALQSCRAHETDHPERCILVYVNNHEINDIDRYVNFMR